MKIPCLFIKKLKNAIIFVKIFFNICPYLIYSVPGNPDHSIISPSIIMSGKKSFSSVFKE